MLNNGQRRSPFNLVVFDGDTLAFVRRFLYGFSKLRYTILYVARYVVTAFGDV